MAKQKNNSVESRVKRTIVDYLKSIGVVGIKTNSCNLSTRDNLCSDLLIEQDYELLGLSVALDEEFSAELNGNTTDSYLEGATTVGGVIDYINEEITAHAIIWVETAE